jgi:ornithine decarboxylase
MELCYQNRRALFAKATAQGRKVTSGLALAGHIVNPIMDHVSPLDYAAYVVDEFDAQGRDEPFYVVDISRILAQHQVWLQNMPHVQQFYAVECNNYKLLLTVLAALGCNFDCASKGEIEAVLELGVAPDRIIYANPCKTASYIKHAAARQVRMMTFDNEQELYKIMKLYPDAELVLRLAVSDPTAVCPLNLKFGCEPELAAPSLLKLAASLNANVVGISFHVGSGCRDPSAYAIGVAYARQMFDIGEQLGLQMRVLDLGGGFPGYKSHLSFETIADVINQSLDRYFPDGCGAQIIAEPGRFYAASAFTLCCTVIARTCVSAERVTKNEQDRDKLGYMYYINDGVYGSFNCILYDHVNPTGVPLKSTKRPTHPSAVWGPTCDSLDLVLPNVDLEEMDEGDWMVFQNMGAYTFAAGSEFNGFPRPDIRVIVTESDNAILHALFLPKNILVEPTQRCLVPESEDDRTSTTSSNESAFSAFSRGSFDSGTDPEIDQFS